MSNKSTQVLLPYLLCCAWLALAPLAPGQEVAPRLTQKIHERLDAETDSLQTLYKHLHSHPELALEEEKTAARLAKELRTLGFEVTTGVGGHGVVGVLKNGEGPTVLVRTDMDGLPISEKTQLPYASKVVTRDKTGAEVGVMHACGHDMHMACWVGTARVLKALAPQWRGTLVFIGQPAEEIGAGARMMLADGLFKRFPRPDYCLGLHCESRTPHGHVVYSDGPLLANVDTVDITVFGKGGHGSAPHTAIDPVVIASRIVLDLQTLVSREIEPGEPAVVTVGSLHAGTKHNIIGADARLQITVRSLKDGVRKHLLEGIARIAKAAAAAARAPEPQIRVEVDNFTPALVNDTPLARKMGGLFRQLLGENKVHLRGPSMGGEDFSRYGREGIPVFFYFLGTMPPERVLQAGKTGEALPSLHSDLYYPEIEPSLRTGVLTMSTAVLHLLRERP